MDALPPNAELHLPVLVSEYQSAWPTLQWPELLAAQVEQETCPSLTSKKCWNPHTENINPKNDGEYGWGLGQLTNTNRYNNFKDMTTRYAGLKSWKWEDRFNPVYQLRTMIYMDLAGYKPFKAAEERDRMAFAFSAYNGGLGGVLNDRKYCAQIEGCNKEVWEGNVETHSLKAKTKLKGYRISAFEINRDYVHNIMNVRGEKYVDRIQDLLDRDAE